MAEIRQSRGALFSARCRKTVLLVQVKVEVAEHRRQGPGYDDDEVDVLGFGGNQDMVEAVVGGAIDLFNDSV